MDDYLTRVAEAVRDVCAETCHKQHAIAERRPIPATICAMHIGHIDLPEIIASVPRPEPVAAQPAMPSWAFQFLSDVVTAAGLIEHGKRDRGLAMRIGQDSYRMRAMLAAAPEAPEPVLDHPASIGGTTFGVGIPVRTLVAAAKRRYEAEQTPASQAERQALIDALRRPVVDVELATLREQNAALVAALEGYMGAVLLMNESMESGINVQGAIAGLIGYEDMARAALASAKGGA